MRSTFAAAAFNRFDNRHPDVTGCKFCGHLFNWCFLGCIRRRWNKNIRPNRSHYYRRIGESHIRIDFTCIHGSPHAKISAVIDFYFSAVGSKAGVYLGSHFCRQVFADHGCAKQYHGGLLLGDDICQCFRVTV